jgi:hypothetical protein
VSEVSPDPQLRLVYEESLRSLEAQRTLIDSVRSRAGTLVFATALVSSLLGGQALVDGLDAWDWPGLVLLLIIGVLAVVIVWPYRAAGFRSDVDDLVHRFVDADLGIDEMHRQLAYRMQEDRLQNIPVVLRMRVAFGVGLACLVLQILAWMLALVV